MKPTSFPTRSVRPLLGGVALVAAFAASAPALAQTQARPPISIGVAPQAARVNPTGRVITLTAPVKDGALYLGDISLTLQPDDRITLPSQRLIELLTNVVDGKTIDALRGAFAGRAEVSPAELPLIQAAYNPQTIELQLTIPPELKAQRSLAVATLDRELIGQVATPAEFSGYLNLRSSIDYDHQGANRGFDDPVFLLDSAVRLGRGVLENEAVYQTNTAADFQRQGTRLVFDHAPSALRVSLGDLLTQARSFQSAPDIAGVSVVRSYGLLQPQRVVRPRGDRNFVLTRPSTVDVRINGQSIRRIRLEPGSYNLRDFPFVQGANDVRLEIEDDTGQRELLNFNLFFDRSQLDTGLSEFGFFAGVKSQLEASGPNYSDEFASTGFYRRGVTDGLTLGANYQVDRSVQMAGVEMVASTIFGTVGVDLAASNVDNFGGGSAATVTLQRLIQRSGGKADALNLQFETRSRNFAQLGVVTPDNRFSYEVGGSYTHAFSEGIYAGVDARYSRGRDLQPDITTVRVSTGVRLSDTISANLDLFHEEGQTRDGVGAFFSIVKRLGRTSSVRADYDSRFDRARVGFQTLNGQGVGAYNVTADVERTPDDTGVNASGSYIANRAEFGFNHFSGFDGAFDTVTDQRTSLRLATSLVFADGAVAVGRPVYDSFALVRPHRTLKDASVVLNPTEASYTARSGALGGAVDTTLSGYTVRTITMEVEGAPLGYDIGSGSAKVFPPYHSGYLIEVGSDYSVTAIGRLTNADGSPVSLLAGTAVELAAPTRAPVTLFTNRDGRFGLTGIRAGQWRIDMPTSPPVSYILTVPESADGVVRAGDLAPIRSVQ